MKDKESQYVTDEWCRNRTDRILDEIQRVRTQTDNIPQIRTDLAEHLAEHRGAEKAMRKSVTTSVAIAKWVGLLLVVCSALVSTVLWIVNGVG